MPKKEYEHPIYSDASPPPRECVYVAHMPAHFARPALRRFVKSAKKAGVFWYQIGHEIGMAFESKEVRDKSAVLFERQLSLNNISHSRESAGIESYMVWNTI